LHLCPCRKASMAIEQMTSVFGMIYFLSIGLEQLAIVRLNVSRLR